MRLSLKLFTGYNLFTAGLFIAANQVVTPQVLADWDATHPSDAPATKDPLALSVASVYYEVIGTLSFALAALPLFGEAAGPVAGCLATMGIMAKHITVNGLMPPPPVMGMVAITALLTLFAAVTGRKGGVGKWAFVIYNVLNAAVFILDPVTPLRDSFPALQDGTHAMALGKIMFEVMGYCSYQLAAITLFDQSAAGYAVGFLPGLAMLYKHQTVDLVGPPMPVLVLFLLTNVLLAKDAVFGGGGAAGKGKKSE